MTRGEYERLRKACETELNADKYFFQDNTTDPHYPWGYGKLRRKDSEFLRAGQEHMKMKTGIFIDIFPRDSVPDGYIPHTVHNAYCFVLRKLLYAEAGMVDKAGYRLLNLIPRTFTFRRLEKLARRYNKNNTRRMRTLTFPYLQKGQRGYNREWFENTKEITFEGYSFFCADDYDGYLAHLYGDYMTPPPPEKRHWHPVSKFRLPGEYGVINE
jgi:lipopolysaccharide cholinephosphotransferase